MQLEKCPMTDVSSTVSQPCGAKIEKKHHHYFAVFARCMHPWLAGSMGAGSMGHGLAVNEYCIFTCSRLGLHLPHKVHSKQSKAKWISDIEELHITLLMNREYDYLNK